MQECNQVGLLLLGQIEIEALVVELNDVVKRGSSSVMEIRSTSGKTAQNGPLSPFQRQRIYPISWRGQLGVTVHASLETWQDPQVRPFVPRFWIALIDTAGCAVGAERARGVAGMQRIGQLAASEYAGDHAE